MAASRRSASPKRLDNAPLDYEPENELGVVFLFANLARKKYALRVARIRPKYPDCIAYRGSERIRIEFELRSSNFARHRHDRRGCDWIVCWRHDWTSAPRNIRIVELRKVYGHGIDVWIVPVGERFQDELSRVKVRNNCWSVPSQSTEGDLVLFYRTRPEGCIKDVFRVDGEVRRQKAGWKSGHDWMAPLRRVATLKTPLHLLDLRSHRQIGSAAFLRGGLQGRPKVTALWPELHEMITERNPSCTPALLRFSPGVIA